MGRRSIIASNHDLRSLHQVQLHKRRNNILPPHNNKHSMQISRGGGPHHKIIISSRGEEHQTTKPSSSCANKSNIATPYAKNTIMHSSNINSISHYFFIISSTFFLSIFICVTILLWKNCKSPLSSSPTKNNTNTTKNDIDDPHHDYINIKSRNNNKNMIFINHNNSNYDNQSFISDVTCSRS